MLAPALVHAPANASICHDVAAEMQLWRRFAAGGTLTTLLAVVESLADWLAFHGGLGRVTLLEAGR